MRLISLLQIVGIFALLLATSFDALAEPGDTTIVQTYTFDAQNNPETAYDSPGRRWFQFPEDDGTEYQKILMYYTLKCFEDGTAGNLGFPCGEWDYLSYTYLFDHTGLLDSSSLTHPRYLANNVEFENIDLIEESLQNQIQYNLEGLALSEDPSQVEYTIGSGASETELAISSQHVGGRAQYLYLPQELTDAGMGNGSYQKLGINCTQLPENPNTWVRLRYKLTSNESLDEFEESGFTEIYSWTTEAWELGMNELNLSTSIDWDGSSSLILELITENSIVNGPTYLASDEVMGNETLALIRAKGDGAGKYAEFTNSDEIKVPAEVFASLDTEVTISFWVNGDPDLQPQNGTCFEGVNAQNNRVLNAHLPWSNSRVYWDAGWDGGYDRIDKAAVASNFEGRWNHWAFTKNTVSGEMKIYLNGQIWHSGTDRDNSLAGVVNFSIGSAAGWSNFYNGGIDEFRIWSKELSPELIEEWMRKPVDASHPEYDQLLLQYHFNEENGEEVQSDGGIAVNGTCFGSVNRRFAPSADLYMNDMAGLDEAASQRPAISFFSGDYEATAISSVYTLPDPVPPLSLVEYEVDGNDVSITSVEYFWTPGYTYTYDENGIAIDSTLHAEGVQSISNETLSYFGAPFEVVDRYEIGRFITPYGIGLNMGEDGWTWVYDVSDFAPLLKGEVELEAGNWQELLDLKFLFIEGTPPREVKRVEKLWAGSYGLSTFNESIVPKTITRQEGEEYFRLKATTSGHQFDNGTNCAEFCYKIHSVLVDAEPEFSWQIMEECADNPLHPQGGTWIYDRAGWCPGAPVTTQNLELSPFVDESFDVDYSIQEDPFGNYVFEGYLISYGEANYTNDVELSEIISPSNWKINSRVNPICNNPVVRIRNNGVNPLTSCRFDFGVNGQLQSYTWNGNLAFMESEEVELAYLEQVMWNGDEDEWLEFQVTVSEPNGASDENESNNTGKSNFQRPPHYYYDDFSDDRIIIWLRTNGAPQESSYSIYDIDGNVVFERDDFTTPNFSYKDTIPLNPGCYLFHLKDAADDGLNFFANNDGSGYCRLKKVSSSGLILFPTNFGKDILHYFSWNMDPLSTPEPVRETADIKVYPNPGNGEFNVELSRSYGNLIMEVHDLQGKLIQRKEELRWSPGMLQRINLSPHPDGVYLLRIFDGKSWHSRKLIKQ